MVENSREELLRQNKQLKEQLVELRETLRAIQSGEVDALVVSTSKGDRVFTLEGADQSYRVLIEGMKEGAVMLSDDGTVLYCNNGLADMVDTSLDKIVGANIRDLISNNHLEDFQELLEQGKNGENPVTKEITLQKESGAQVPALMSFSRLGNGGVAANYLVVTDLSRHMEEDVKRYTDSLEQEIKRRIKVEEALRASKELRDTIFASMADAVVVLDESGTILDFNEAFAHFCRFKSKKETLRSIDEFSSLIRAYHLDGTALPVDEWPASKALRGETGVNQEYIIERADSGERWISSTSYAPLRGRNDEVTGAVQTMRDITTRKREEAILREQSLIIRSAPDAIFSTDSSFNIKSWNSAAERIFGWTADEVVGKTSTSLFNPVYPTLNGTTRKQALEQLMKKGFWKGEIIYHKKDGSPVPVSVSSSLLRAQNGDFAGAVAVVHDITARKERENALRRSVEMTSQRAEELETLMDIIPVAVWISRDPQCQNITGNQAANTFYEAGRGENVSAGPITGASQDYTRRFFHDGRPLNAEELPMQVAAAENIEVRDSELEVLLPSGKKISILGNAKPLLNDEGKVRGCVAAFLDISERRKIEEALKKSEWVSRQRAEKLEKLKSKLEEKAAEIELYASRMEELAEERAKKLQDAKRLAAIGATAGMVGHDIRNPLQAITGDLYLVKCDLASMPEGEGKEGIKESIVEIEKNVEYIEKIVQDLQDFAKPLKPTAKEIDVEEICQEVLFKNGIPEKIGASCEVEANVKKVIADPDLLKRILSNLVKNSVQAMPDGGKLEIRAFQDAAEFVISVQDTGVGIPEEIKPNLFVPLFTTKSKGQGFGLAIVKRMTEALGGTVTFESEMGKGAKFIVRLPPPKELNGKWVFTKNTS